MAKQTLRSFRLVCRAHERDTACALLRSQGYEFEPEPFSPWAFRLTAEPRPLGGSLAAFFGLVYIQDRSSMLPPLALAPKPGGTALDMCASPGSKTGFLAQLVGENGFVAGNEPNRTRLGTLRQNLVTLNLMNTATISCPGEALPLAPDGLDAIQLDPPCSGWGTVDRNPNVLELWRGDRVKPLIGLQRLLLARAAMLVKPGGRLVYSTCTTNPDENEEQVRYALDCLGLRLDPLPDVPGFVMDAPKYADCDGTWRVNGADSDAQGFYVAAFVKDAPYSGSDNSGSAPENPEHRAGSGRTPGRRSGSRAVNAAAGSPRGEAVSRECLESACLDASSLPEGRIAAFNGTAYFLPRKAEELFAGVLPWQGFALGKAGGSGLRTSPRLRGLMRPVGEGPCLDVEEPEAVTGLLAGQSMRVAIPGGPARESGFSGDMGLYFRGMPLGLLRVKNGRAFWSEG